MKNKKKRTLGLFLVCLSALIAVFILPETALAWWGSDIPEGTVDFLKNHSDWLQRADILPVIGHMIGWGLIKGLYFLVGILEGLVPQTLDLSSFLESAGISSLATAVINDLVLVLMVLTIVIIGIKVIIAKEPPKFKSVGVNIIVSALLIVGLPTLMNTMQGLALNFYNATQSSGESGVESLSWGLIKDNTADLLYTARSDVGFGVIANDADTEGVQTKNILTKNTFSDVNMNEILTADAVEESDNSSLEPLKYQLAVDENNSYTAVKMKGNFFSFFSSGFDPGYFRFPVKFTPILIGLLALGVAYIFAIFTFISTIFEIGIKRVVGLFVFATDLESGQRTKMVVNDLMNAYLLIAFTGLSLRFYTIFLSYLSVQQPNIFIYVIAIVSATFILIKGSTTIMRYFGVDVGLKEGYGQLAGAFALGKTLGHIGKKASVGKSRKSGRNVGDNDEDTPSINDKIKGAMSNVGQTAGYMKNRGVKGMMKDSVKAPIAVAGAGMKGYSDSLKDGYAQGTEKASSNSDKYDSKNKASSINDENEKNNESTSPNNNSADHERDQRTNKSVNNESTESRTITNQVEEVVKGSGDAQNSSATRQVNEIVNGTGSSQSGSATRQTDEIVNGTGSSQSGSATRQTDEIVNGSGSSQTSPVNRQIDEIVNGTGSSQSGSATRQTDEIVNGSGSSQTSPVNRQIDEIVNGSGSSQTSPVNRQIDEIVNGSGSSQTSPVNRQIDEIVNGTGSNQSSSTTRQVDEIVNGSGSSQSSSATRQIDEIVNGTGSNQISSTTRQVDEIVNGSGSNQSGSTTRQVDEIVNGSGSNQSGSTTRQVDEIVNGSGSNQSGSSTRQVDEIVNGSGSNQSGSSTRQVDEIVNSSGSNQNGSATRQTREETIQKVIQEVQKANFNNPEQATQQVIQQVQLSNIASPEQKQRIVQEVTNAKNLSPEQLTQNIQQVLNTVGQSLPNETVNTVQKVLQDVQKGANYSPEEIKTKVVQEIQKDTSTNEPIRQKVLQDVQKAFTATPEQLEQNIKQVIETQSTNGVTNNIKEETSSKVQEEVTNKQVNNNTSYFGKLFGEDLQPQKELPVRKGRRFSAFKNV